MFFTYFYIIKKYCFRFVLPVVFIFLIVDLAKGQQQDYKITTENKKIKLLADTEPPEIIDNSDDDAILKKGFIRDLPRGNNLKLRTVSPGDNNNIYFDPRQFQFDPGTVDSITWTAKVVDGFQPAFLWLSATDMGG